MGNKGWVNPVSDAMGTVSRATDRCGSVDRERGSAFRRTRPQWRGVVWASS